MTGRMATTLVLISIGLAACGTTGPTRYLTLSPVPPDQVGAGGEGLVLRAPTVRWPAAMDRLEVVRPHGDIEVTLEEQVRWSAAPGRLAAQALMEDLLARLPGARFAPAIGPAPAEAASVAVEVETFREEPTGYALVAIVTVTQGNEPPVSQIVVAEAAGPHDADGEARAISRLLGAVADRIAGSVEATLRASAAPSAQTASPRPRP